MAKRIKWRVSASKMESASRGCKLFEEDERVGAEYKNAGTDAHLYMEKMELPLSGAPEELRGLIEFCRDWSVEFETTNGPFLLAEYEATIKGSELHPPGKIDRLYLTESGMVLCADFKFGTQPVPSPTDNAQVKEYLYMAKCLLEQKGLLPRVTSWMGMIIQPYLGLVDVSEITLEDIEATGEEMRKLNAALWYPFNQPDPSDPTKCQRCLWAAECPAVTSAVQRFANRDELVAFPENFLPENLATDRDRVLALDLGAVLSAWYEQVKRNCRDYAAANGGTIAGIYNLSQRANGFEVDDIPAFADGLVEQGLLADRQDVLQFVRLRKTALVDGLASPELPKEAVAAAVKKLEKRLGVPRPPVSVFRRGGKKQVKAAEELLDVPMLVNPFKKKHSDE